MDCRLREKEPKVRNINVRYYSGAAESLSSVMRNLSVVRYNAAVHPISIELSWHFPHCHVSRMCDERRNKSIERSFW